MDDNKAIRRADNPSPSVVFVNTFLFILARIRRLIHAVITDASTMTATTFDQSN